MSGFVREDRGCALDSGNYRARGVRSVRVRSVVRSALRFECARRNRPGRRYGVLRILDLYDGLGRRRLDVDLAVRVPADLGGDAARRDTRGCGRGGRYAARSAVVAARRYDSGRGHGRSGRGGCRAGPPQGVSRSAPFEHPSS